MSKIMAFNTIGIVSIYVGLNGLIILALAYNVGRHRARTKAFIPGSMGDEILVRAIRAHGNAIEYIPWALLMMLMISLLSCPAYLLHGMGIIFTFGRLAQAYGMTREKHPNVMRFIGNLVTGLVYLFGSLLCFYFAFHAGFLKVS